MYHVKTYLILSYLTLFVFAKESESPCVTPNGEKALCVPISNCKVIIQALTSLKEDLIEFAKKSQCGSDDGDDPLVCCGSYVGHARPDDHKVVAPIDNVYLPDDSLCGIQSKEEKMPGDQLSTLDEFPWIAVLRYAKNDDASSISSFCSGTVINHRYVVTSAECLEIPGYNLIGVRLGEWQRSTDDDCEDEENVEICADSVLDVSVIEKIIHPFYSQKTRNNNIALLLLEKKVKYSAFIRPICLPPPDVLPLSQGDKVVVAGWSTAENGSLFDVTMQATFVVEANKECTSILPNSTREISSQICSDANIEFRGNTGGPLMRMSYTTADSEREQWYLEGIIFKLNEFEKSGAPLLYVKIPKYSKWILNNLKHP